MFFKKRNVVKRFGNEYPANSIIFKTGEVGNEMFIIQKGEVRIALDTANAQHVLAVLQPGDFFGEMAIFTEHMRTATAVASQPSLLLRIPGDSITLYMLRNKDFAFKLAQRLSQRLTAANKQIEALVSLSRELRILKALVAFWQQHGMQSGEQMIISYGAFVDFAGTSLQLSREDTNIGLQKLKDQQILTVKKDKQGNVFVYFLPSVFDYFSNIGATAEGVAK